MELNICESKYNMHNTSKTYCLCCYYSEQSWDWFDAALHPFLFSVSPFIPQYPLQPTSSKICITYYNLTLPFLFRLSTVLCRIVFNSPLCLSVCPINLLWRLFILAYKLLLPIEKSYVGNYIGNYMVNYMGCYMGKYARNYIGNNMENSIVIWAWILYSFPCSFRYGFLYSFLLIFPYLFFEFKRS